MNKNKVNNQLRSVSAKFSSQQRQLRNSQGKTINKRNGRVNTQSHEVDHIINKSRGKFYTTGFQISQKNAGKMNKQAEQLIQENFHLKNQLNQLNNKLCLTKGKIQSQKKKHFVYAKKLNRQFEKELYWPNQKQKDYLIAGIKHQYQKLKQVYQEKCNQLQRVNKQIDYTQVQQISAYCEALETQNKILIQNITFLKKNKKNSAHSASLNHSHHQDNFQLLFLQEKRKLQDSKKRLIKSQQKLTSELTIKKELQKRINFLQKLIIQKQNSSYHAHKKVKTIQKQKKKLINDLKIFETKIIQNEKVFHNKIQELNQSNNKQANAQKIMFQKLIRQKNIAIEKLQKEIGYLSTLLSYWKPLDQLSKFDKIQENSQKDKTFSLNNNSNLHPGYSKQIINRSKTPIHSKLVDQHCFQQNQKYGLKSLSNQQLSIDKELMLQTIPNQQDQDGQISRQPRRSNKKWNSNAKKCRKISFSQVQYLGQLILYKMIAYNISLQKIKQYFSYKGPKQSIFKLQEEFISMKQIRNIFMSKPFSLTSDQAFILSRYIIEQQGFQYVYCHEDNELERSIVKSIVKTLVGQYTNPDVQKCEGRWKQIKRQYSHNLQLALKSICPKGIISKDKFLQLISSLGIEMEDETKNYLIGKLVENEKSLSELKYDMIFTAQERIN